jgi:hypothetical protein
VFDGDAGNDDKGLDCGIDGPRLIEPDEKLFNGMGWFWVA